jgi:hypothetical protein
MTTLDIFKNDAFGLTTRTKAINDFPFRPGRLGELGLFSEEGITTTTLNIEREGTTLTLVSNTPRGSSGQVKNADKRTLIPIRTTHLAQRSTIGADEVQGVRAFGTDSQFETIANVVNKRQAKHRRDLDATIEYQRIGAIKGQVLDADGTTVLLDLYNTFNVTQQVKALSTGTATTKVIQKLIEAKRLSESKLGNLQYASLRLIASSGLFDSIVNHPTVQTAYERWQTGDFLRADNRKGFYYGGIWIEEYRGGVNGVDFIDAGEGYLIPEGVPDLFITNFAPADYMETANTIGLPYYSKLEPLDFNKGMMLESQSNPISINTRPDTVIKITT